MAKYTFIIYINRTQGKESSVLESTNASVLSAVTVKRYIVQ